jgi:predicted transcriptional regulator of viral defense system
VKTDELFETFPVFSLDEAAWLLETRGGRRGAVERLKHHLRSGRLVLAGRGLYAVVPEDTAPEAFLPDPLLVAAAARSDAVFCYHSALELLGVAGAVAGICTIYTSRRRRPAGEPATGPRFLDDPGPLRAPGLRLEGTLPVERGGRCLRVTGPERTLVEGFRRPDLSGGPTEFIRAAGRFESIDFDLLLRLLELYGIAGLWAATGWFLEISGERWPVPPGLIGRMESRRPAQARYLTRSQRGGKLAARWNLILPDSVLSAPSG